MLATLLRSLQIGLGALCLYLLYLAVLPLVSASPIRDIEQAEIRRSQPADTQPAHYAVISTRNLFKTRAAPVKIDTQGSELDEEHPESKLRIALVGTLASTNPRLSIATVQDQTSRESLMLRVGDDIKGAEIERIERRRIVVRNRGKLEQVTLEEELAKAKTPSRARTRSAHTRRPNRVRQRRPPPPVETPASSSSAGNAFDAATFIPGLELNEAAGETIRSVNGIQQLDAGGEVSGEFISALLEPGQKKFVIVDRNGVKREVVKGESE